MNPSAAGPKSECSNLHARHGVGGGGTGLMARREGGRRTGGSGGQGRRARAAHLNRAQTAPPASALW
eukprot:scaffold52942_cov50-Phaeocystis_antarctica.AAC.5